MLFSCSFQFNFSIFSEIHIYEPVPKFFKELEKNWKGDIVQLCRSLDMNCTGEELICKDPNTPGLSPCCIPKVRVINDILYKIKHSFSRQILRRRRMAQWQCVVTTTARIAGNVRMLIQHISVAHLGVMENANGMNMVSIMRIKARKKTRLNGEYIFISWALELKLGRLK